ncbi:hypothetical protein C8R43DRAFT_1154419 [Mycena crocata]|nr:hypothetical protein C8R43DRAFT_1154419 [Mycena crocata]
MSILDVPLPLDLAKDQFAQLVRTEPEKVSPNFTAATNSQSLIRAFACYQAWTSREIFVLAQLSKASQEEDIQFISSDYALKTFLYHLDRDSPAAVKPPVTNDASERAWASLIGLEAEFSAYFSTYPDSRIRLVSAWPHIFKWCLYFYHQRIVCGTDADAAQRGILTISSAILALSMDTELRTTVRATGGLVALCTRLCIHPASPMSTCILFSILAVDTSEALDSVVDAAGGKPEVVVKAFLTRL